MQVQYSLIDQRPAAKVEAVCLSHDIQLLTYGTLAGGLLSERYLGKAEPTSRAELNNASLSKYKNMIDSCGGWGLFQELLVALETVTRGHGCSIANVATHYVLDRPAVGGVIVGCHLGVAGAEHRGQPPRLQPRIGTHGARPAHHRWCGAALA
ncbi:unnamed protein product [Oncorhynchus mykiss]|uniref:NADP-dependent oxidoreductase domain-containing protein n=1 Tax=Oncorhynchus mykiss TaxID=8022 RepID=A0A060YT10_ONCMY|nr:unnamed protein product [Oncorhynchus mykiss]